MGNRLTSGTGVCALDSVAEPSQDRFSPEGSTWQVLSGCPAQCTEWGQARARAGEGSGGRHQAPAVLYSRVRLEIPAVDGFDQLLSDLDDLLLPR